MPKTFLYRLFGIGKIPAPLMSELNNEGILLLDEGVRGSVTYRNFRAPGKRSNWRRQWFTAAIALTKIRLLALSYANPMINVPVADERMRAMRYSLEAGVVLCIGFDAGEVHR